MNENEAKRKKLLYWFESGAIPPPKDEVKVNTVRLTKEEIDALEARREPSRNAAVSCKPPEGPA